MKADQTRDGDHGGRVEDFIEAHPAEWSQEELCGVDSDGDNVRDTNVATRYARRMLPPCDARSQRTP